MRLKTLNGAPLCADLDFSPQALLPPEVLLEEGFWDPKTAQDTDTPPKWRHLTPKEARLHSGWSQPYLPSSGIHGNDPDISFGVPGVGASPPYFPDDTTNLDTTIQFEDTTITDGDFVEQSLIFHDNLVSSQIESSDHGDRTVSASSFLGSSFETGTPNMDSFKDQSTQAPILQVPSSVKLTSLGSLPTAKHLRSIHPQTPTPNILCALASPPEDREVTVKKSGHRMHLREITVADDTATGFKISFWSRPPGTNRPQNALHQTLERIRVGDILLLRNIALNTFRDNVYGQSLNPSIARVRTSIEILMSSSGVSSRQLGALPASVVGTFMRVKNWAKKHIASETPRRSKRTAKNSDTYDDALPPDTMESV